MPDFNPDDWRNVDLRTAERWEQDRLRDAFDAMWDHVSTFLSETVTTSGSAQRFRVQYEHDDITTSIDVVATIVAVVRPVTYYERPSKPTDGWGVYLEETQTESEETPAHRQHYLYATCPTPLACARYLATFPIEVRAARVAEALNDAAAPNF